MNMLKITEVDDKKIRCLENLHCHQTTYLTQYKKSLQKKIK